MSDASQNGDRTPEVREEYVLRLGGMALRNGLLIHGPTSWAAAARDDAGEIQVASGPKPAIAPELAVRVPLLRGPLRLAEAFILIPMVRLRLRAARLPFEDVRVIAAMLIASTASRALRRRGSSAGERADAGGARPGAGDGRAQRSQPGRLPRRRAQGDRRLRGRLRRPGLRHQGARALRLQPGRSDARPVGRRPAAARAHAGEARAGGAGGRRRRRAPRSPPRCSPGASATPRPRRPAPSTARDTRSSA